MIKTDVYEPGSLTRARVRRIPAFLSVALTTYVILLYRFRFVNHFSRNFQYFFGSSPPRFCPVFSTALSYFSLGSVFSQTHIKNPQCLSFRQNNFYPKPVRPRNTPPGAPYRGFSCGYQFYCIISLPQSVSIFFIYFVIFLFQYPNKPKK